MINVFHDITDERSAEARHPLPGRGEHAPLRLARLRGDARRPRAPARPADRRLLHRGHDRRGRSKPSAGRRSRTGIPSGKSCCASCGGATRRRRTRPIRSRRCSRAASHYLIEDARGGALAHAAVDEEHLALYHALGRDVLHRRAAPGARPAARDDLARHRASPGAGSGRPTSSSRTRSRGARRSRSTTRASSGCAGVVRPARHAARVGAGGDRLLGSRASLRPGERRTRRGQPQDAGGARRPDARGGDPDTRPDARCRSTGRYSSRASRSSTPSRPTTMRWSSASGATGSRATTPFARPRTR